MKEEPFLELQVMTPSPEASRTSALHCMHVVWLEFETQKSNNYLGGLFSYEQDGDRIRTLNGKVNQWWRVRVWPAN